LNRDFTSEKQMENQIQQEITEIAEKKFSVASATSCSKP